MEQPSTNESQLDYLRKEIRERLAHVESSIGYYRGRHYKYQSSTVVLAALITILSGLKLKASPDATSLGGGFLLTDATLVLAAVSTVLAAFGSFFSPQQSWYLNAEIAGKLRALQAQLEFSERDPHFDGNQGHILAEIFDRYQRVMDEYNQKWLQLRQKSK